MAASEWTYQGLMNAILMNHYLFHDGGPYPVETSPLICKANHWNGFYMIGIFVMKELIAKLQCYGLDQISLKLLMEYL